MGSNADTDALQETLSTDQPTLSTDQSATQKPLILLHTHDWGQEWRDLAKNRRPAPTAAHWDERAPDYPCSSTASPYVKKFIAYADIHKGETVFDMGCGNGAIAIPLALDGHEVIAADFSERMLDSLNSEAHMLGGLPITCIHMSWDDDWQAFGVMPKSVDVAVASRSVSTDDLADSLARLDRVARRRCAVTLPLGGSPRSDPRILAELELPLPQTTSFEYAFLILTAMGRLPEVRYIKSEKPNVFADADEAICAICRMASDAVLDAGGSPDEVDAACQRASTWAMHHLVANPQAGATSERGVSQGAVMLDVPRTVTWAHLAWNV